MKTIRGHIRINSVIQLKEGITDAGGIIRFGNRTLQRVEIRWNTPRPEQENLICT